MSARYPICLSRRAATFWLMTLSSQSSTRRGRRLARVGSSLAVVAGALGAAALAPDITRSRISWSWAGLIGLVRQPAKAALAKSALSDRTPTEVSSTSGRLPPPGSLRISPANVKPSMPGICISRMARSKRSPARIHSMARGALCVSRGIMPHLVVCQVVVVIEVFVAQCQPEHALHDQIQQRVLYLIGLAVIGEAGGEPAHDPSPRLQFLQHQHSAIGGDVATIEAPNQLPPSQLLRRFEWLSEGIESSRSR